MERVIGLYKKPEFDNMYFEITGYDNLENEELLFIKHTYDEGNLISVQVDKYCETGNNPFYKEVKEYLALQSKLGYTLDDVEWLEQFNHDKEQESDNYTKQDLLKEAICFMKQELSSFKDEDMVISCFDMLAHIINNGIDITNITTQEYKKCVNSVHYNPMLYGQFSQFAMDTMGEFYNPLSEPDAAYVGMIRQIVFEICEKIYDIVGFPKHETQALTNEVIDNMIMYLDNINTSDFELYFESF